jgi:hypothetical protein
MYCGGVRTRDDSHEKPTYRGEDADGAHAKENSVSTIYQEEPFCAQPREHSGGHRQRNLRPISSTAPSATAQYWHTKRCTTPSTCAANGSPARPARDKLRAFRRSQVSMAAMSVSAETTATAYVSAGPVRPSSCGNVSTRVLSCRICKQNQSEWGSGRTSPRCTRWPRLVCESASDGGAVPGRQIHTKLEEDKKHLRKDEYMRYSPQ